MPKIRVAWCGLLAIELSGVAGCHSRDSHPGADGYLAHLDRGRVAAVADEPADRALREVARRWSERTQSLGTDRQLWHYRRSLNTLVTTPEPPER